MKSSASYDITIIGGGPAGCAAAIILQKHSNLSVLVIERGQSAQHKAGESIPPDSRLLFQQLGIWQEFLDEKHESCLGNSSSWGDDDLGYSDFIYNPMGQGWHLERKRFNQFMLDQISNTTIDLRLNTKFIKSDFQQGEYELTLQENQVHSYSIKSKYVIDATGSRSNFSRKQSANKNYHDDLVCITCFFDQVFPSNFNELTLLEAVEYGWWYSAKLPNQQLAVALACDKSFSKMFKLNKFDNWFKLLKHHSQHIYPKMISYSYSSQSLLINTAPSFILDKIVQPFCLAIGDAASAYDPISAQGIYKAMANGITAAKAIIKKFEGNNEALSTYEQIVRLDFDNYIANKNYLYSRENRWPNSPFWKNRKNSHLEASG